ncbi:merozoite surface antigen 2-like [Hyalella azteca]|uniref:Merozoite surface antigen 2-like n=1 Tax=Hyalella azteca TaxID=294128 RepID=A0A979FL51_HYAAZ|nr:merozoite surface antigen 2-like [Hyalella azteca]
MKKAAHRSAPPAFRTQIIRPRGDHDSGIVRPRGDHDSGIIRPRGDHDSGIIRPRGDHDSGIIRPRGDHDSGIVNILKLDDDNEVVETTIEVNRANEAGDTVGRHGILDKKTGVDKNYRGDRSRAIAGVGAMSGVMAITGAGAISGDEAISGAGVIKGAGEISEARAFSGAIAISGADATSGTSAISEAEDSGAVAMSGDEAIFVAEPTIKDEMEKANVVLNREQYESTLEFQKQLQQQRQKQQQNQRTFAPVHLPEVIRIKDKMKKDKESDAATASFLPPIVEKQQRDRYFSKPHWTKHI